MVVVADASTPAVQALVRWDQAGFADRELAERAALRLPPEARMASLTGSAGRARGLPGGGRAAGRRRGAGAGAGRARTRSGSWCARRATGGPATVAALKAAAGVRSAHKESGSVRLQVDPLEIA